MYHNMEDWDYVSHKVYEWYTQMQAKKTHTSKYSQKMKSKAIRFFPWSSWNPTLDLFDDDENIVNVDEISRELP